MTYARDQAGHRVTTEILCYRARNLIERFFNKLKQWRHLATRCDKLVANYLAFVKLASIAFVARANTWARDAYSSQRDHQSPCL